jgi:predicted nucleic acid-binding protein
VVIIDTSVWIEYLRGNAVPETRWLLQELQRQRMGLTSLILCEVLQGTPDSQFARVRADLQKFVVFNECTTELAITGAKNYRKLRSKGYTIRATIDCLIASFCLENGHSLLHRDRDFDAFETALGLKVIHP